MTANFILLLYDINKVFWEHRGTKLYAKGWDGFPGELKFELNLKG